MNIDKKTKRIIIASVISFIMFFISFNTVIWVIPQRIHTDSRTEIVWLKGRQMKGQVKFIDSPLSVWYNNMDTTSSYYRNYIQLPILDQIVVDQLGEILMIEYMETYGKRIATLPFSQKLYDWTY